MSPHRPVSVLVIAIFCLIGGAFGTCCYLPAVSEPLLKSVFTSTDGEERLDEEPKDELKLWRQRNLYLKSVLNLLPSLGLVVAGIGLLRMRPWARTLALFCATFLTLSSLLATVKSGRIALAKLVEATMPAPPGAPWLPKLASSIVEVAEGLFWLALAVVLVVVPLLLRSVQAAFREQGQAVAPRPRPVGEEEELS
jgi:hypothetical protein